MAQKIFIGQISKGLEQFYLPFNIDNDAFPTLYNFYTWRGRVKKKRGTVPLGRLQVQIEFATDPANWEHAAFNLSSGKGDLLTQISATVGQSVAPGSISLIIGSNTYTEPSPPDGTLVGVPAGDGTINYATGEFSITGGGSDQVTGQFGYFPSYPVMGLEDLIVGYSQYPLLLSFDTTYAYQLTSNASNFYNVSYYKSTNNPVTWSGQNYQQFWSTNYQAAFWATNNVPGMRISWVHACSNQTGTTIEMTLYNQADNAPLTTLIVNDYLWFNEGTASTSWTLNGQTGYVSTVNNASAGQYTITFATSQTVDAYNADTALAQLLTSQGTGTGDGIRWYDGDPTSGTGLPTGDSLGWVNFSPPLTASSVSIDEETSELYYLVGALLVVPFKDRLVFFSPWIQTSAQGKAGTPAIQLNDVALWSWNGTPYYSSLTPSGETSDIRAYYVDEAGFGGWISAGINQNIVSVNNNEDVLLVGFTGKQTRFAYTSNDYSPFLFYIVNSELGTQSTFSTITLDRGALSMGPNGFILTTQVDASRIDLQIPNQVFELNASNHAALRVSSSRDYFHEWVYFTFSPNSSPWVFPTQTLQYNYRENSWALHYENFTAHGLYRASSGYTWTANPWNMANIGWAGITESWSSGTITALFPSVVAGSPQGFVLVKGQGVGEAPSGSIAAISASSGFTQITSYNHCVSVGDYLYFLNCLGSTYLNTQIGKVTRIIDANNFVVDVIAQSGTYTGLGTFTRLVQPLLQTKQFPLYWSEGRKIRIGAQKYLMDATDNAQASLYIYLSQNPDDAWNNSPISPSLESTNDSLIYSTILYTCPESTNIGLTQITQSLNNPNPIAGSQYQIWHRVNTSLIGDTFQIGITLNDAQMRNYTYATSEITLNSAQFDVFPGPLLT